MLNVVIEQLDKCESVVGKLEKAFTQKYGDSKSCKEISEKILKKCTWQERFFLQEAMKLHEKRLSVWNKTAEEIKGLCV